jgi:electron transport complex protein RnfE
MERFIRGVIPENPVYRQLLGLCPILAVTNGVATAMTMAGATAFVLICSNLLISSIRGLLKPHLRILVFTLTIATFVTIVDKALAAYLYSMSKALGPYIPLIIVNCLIIARCEMCASKSSLPHAFMDGLGNAVGFALALLSISTVRELLGAGTWFGIQILPQSAWPGWGVLVLPPGAFLTLGILLAIVEWYSKRKKTSAPETSTSTEASAA